ncbi:hypothetical protein Dimus_011522 [Dionaea muscipula]
MEKPIVVMMKVKLSVVHLLLLLIIIIIIFSSLPPCSSSSSSSRIPLISIHEQDDHVDNNIIHGSLTERLIRALNLFPRQPANIVHGSSYDHQNNNNNIGPSRLVEKRFKFPNANYSSLDDLSHHAGYYSLNHTYGARMFYFFFESRNNNTQAPVVVWLTGGPGCSSSVALFAENGPFKIDADLTLVPNNYGWDQVSNIIFVDQPVGTGFSYSNDSRDICHDEKGVSNDLYDFIQAFFAAHPEYVKNDFYITGESYAGHYVPAFASRVHQGNQAAGSGNIKINLKGIAIGNGLTDPGIQYPAYPDFALANKLIDKQSYDQIKQMVPSCQSAIQSCGTDGTDTCLRALSNCENIFYSIVQQVPGINYYDIRKECQGSLCYDFSNIDQYLNQQSVKSALGVGNNIDWVACSTGVYDNMLQDWMRNLAVGIPTFLDQGVIQVLIYAGEDDLICNWLGNSRWVHAMKWSGQDKFASASEVPFQVDGTAAGLLTKYGPLSFLKVHNAGHMVPMDQPRAALEMLTRFMNGTLGSK